MVDGEQPAYHIKMLLFWGPAFYLWYSAIKDMAKKSLKWNFPWDPIGLTREKDNYWMAFILIIAWLAYFVWLQPGKGYWG